MDKRDEYNNNTTTRSSRRHRHYQNRTGSSRKIVDSGEKKGCEGGAGGGGGGTTRTHHRHRQQDQEKQKTHYPLPETRGASLATVLDRLNSASRIMLHRRPLLHIIVLFAGDMRMRRFAYNVEERFISNGVNVFLQMEIEEPRQFIRPEFLQRIISESRADFLVVLGDKNMRNGTCHARKSGKLIEMPIEDRVKSIASEWKQSTSANAQRSKKLFGEKTSQLTNHMLLELIEIFSGIKHIGNRLNRLETKIREFQDWHPKSMGQSPLDRVGLGDEKMFARLTTTQNSAIRFHREITKAANVIDDIQTDEINARNTDNGVKLSSITGYQIGISSELKSRLCEACQGVLRRIENLGHRLSQLTNHTSLWDMYIQGQHVEPSLQPQHENVQYDLFDSLPSEAAWQCTKCTYLNEPRKGLCAACGEKEDKGQWRKTSKRSQRRRPRYKEVLSNDHQPAKQTLENQASEKRSPSFPVAHQAKTVQGSKSTQHEEPNHWEMLVGSPVLSAQTEKQSPPVPSILQPAYGTLPAHSMLSRDSPRSEDSSSSGGSWTEFATGYEIRQHPQKRYLGLGSISPPWHSAQQQMPHDGFHGLADSRNRSGSNSSYSAIRSSPTVTNSPSSTSGNDRSAVYSQSLVQHMSSLSVEHSPQSSHGLPYPSGSDVFSEEPSPFSQASSSSQGTPFHGSPLYSPRRMPEDEIWGSSFPSPPNAPATGDFNTPTPNWKPDYKEQQQQQQQYGVILPAFSLRTKEPDRIDPWGTVHQPPSHVHGYPGSYFGYPLGNIPNEPWDSTARHHLSNNRPTTAPGVPADNTHIPNVGAAHKLSCMICGRESHDLQSHENMTAPSTAYFCSVEHQRAAANIQRHYRHIQDG